MAPGSCLPGLRGQPYGRLQEAVGATTWDIFLGHFESLFIYLSKETTLDIRTFLCLVQ